MKMQVKKYFGLLNHSLEQEPPALPILKPLRRKFNGKHVTIEALNIEAHADILFEMLRSNYEANSVSLFPKQHANNYSEFREWLETILLNDTVYSYTLFDLRTRSPFGFLSFKNIMTEHQVIECAHAYLISTYNKSLAETEAMYLILQHVFDELNYHQYIWHCAAHDKEACGEAERLGFKVEKMAKQDCVYSEHVPQCTYYSMTKSNWLLLKEKFIKWLEPTNFDHNGNQIFSLLEI